MSQRSLASNPTPSPTVFISYAHESEDLRASVKTLADWLGNHDCTVLTDHAYAYRPPEAGWLVWMLNCIEVADTVLVVCTPKLKARYDKNAAPDEGRGATYEGAIVTQHIYDNAMRNTKFFPILPDDGQEDNIPMALKPWWNNHWFPSGTGGIHSMIFAGSSDLKPPSPSPLPDPSRRAKPTRLVSSSDLWSYPVIYVQELFELVSGPKRFIAQHRSEGTLTIGRALGFLALSILITWSIPPHGKLAIFTSDIFFIIAQVMMYALALVVAWRIVGSSARLLDYLPVHFYYSAIFSFLIVLANRISLGLLKNIDEQFYKDLMDAVMAGSLAFFLERASNTPVPVLIIAFVGSMVTHALLLGWFVAGWGAYRVLNRVSRRRSLVAALIFLALCVPIFATLGLVASALQAALTG